MSFLTPFFLLAGIAIAIPLILHFTRHRPKNVTPFSASIFLPPDRPTLRKRRHLENWPLLLLRCLILLLLAAAFARPFFNDPITTLDPRANQRVIILLDTSASMTAGERTRPRVRDATSRRITRQSASEPSLEAVRQITTNLPPTTDLALITFARRPTTHLDFEQWRAIPPPDRAAHLESLLANLEATDAATNPGEALVAANDLLAASASPDPATIHLISDFQQTADFEAVTTIDWPENVTVHPIRVPHDTDAIPTLTLASATETEITLIATNPGPANTATLTPTNHQSPITSHQLPIPPGTTPITFPADLTTASYTATLTGTDSPFATVYVAQSRPPTIAVDYLGTDDPTDTTALLFFLTRALANPTRFTTNLAINQPRDDAFTIIATDFTEPTAAPLRTQLLAGSHALLLLRNRADARWIEALTGDSATAREAATPQFALLTALDYTDPIIAPFADPRFSDFSKIHVWKHRALTGPALIEATTLASFDDGTPALLRIPVGEGSLLVLTTTWTPADSQLAVSSKFVPLLLSILETTATLPPTQRQYLVGERTPPGVRDAASRRITRQSAAEPNTDTPGLHETPSFTYAVNVDPRESDLTPLPEAALLALDLPTAEKQPAATKSTPDRTRQLALQELEARHPLWPTLLIATLAVIFAETTLATRIQSAIRNPQSAI